MKHIIKYLGALLAVVLIGSTFTACSDDDSSSANVGLGIKVFFPTKVVTNQPITINGSGFDNVTEIAFPGGATVTDFDLVSDDMIRVNTPAGIPAEGGKIVVRTADGQAESRLPLTLGHTNVTGFSKQPGETAAGGELITVYGSDLEFINGVELLDPDSVSQIIDQKDFYRKGTNTLIFRVPEKNIYKGTFVGTLHTYDGQSFSLPELAYEPAADEGHWETVKTVVWTNSDPETNGVVSWSGTYRFAPESNSTGEEIYTVPQDVWERMKTETFYLKYTAADPSQYQIRVTTGWWAVQWLGADNDIAPWNMAERIMDNGDGTFFIEVNFGDDPIVGSLDDQHLLFTGNGYTPLEIYFEEEVWVGGGEDVEVEVPVWTNSDPETNGVVSWSGTYRFAPESNSTGEEIYTVPQDIWERLKTETFYLKYTAADPSQYQIRITTGWWAVQWLGADNDIAPWNMAERIIDNGDGTFYIEINFGDDPIVGSLDDQHLLFTGNGYTPLAIYFIDVIKGSGGGGAPSDYDISAFTLYEDQSANVSWPYYPSWGDNSGKLRIMRGRGDNPIETLGLTTNSKFIVYKEAGTTGQIQFNNPNWVDLQAGCADWDGSAETIEVPITDDMLKCISGEVVDGWSDTALILQGDGLTVTKIVIVP